MIVNKKPDEAILRARHTLNRINNAFGSRTCVEFFSAIYDQHEKRKSVAILAELANVKSVHDIILGAFNWLMPKRGVSYWTNFMKQSK